MSCTPDPKWWTISANGQSYRCAWNAIAGEWHSHEAFEADATCLVDLGALKLRISAREAAESGLVPIGTDDGICGYSPNY